MIAISTLHYHFYKISLSRREQLELPPFLFFSGEIVKPLERPPKENTPFYERLTTQNRYHQQYKSKYTIQHGRHIPTFAPAGCSRVSHQPCNPHHAALQRFKPAHSTTSSSPGLPLPVRTCPRAVCRHRQRGNHWRRGDPGARVRACAP